MAEKERHNLEIKTTLAARYWVKTIIMFIVCLVLGLWGVWDYVVAIPRAATEAARADTLRLVKNGLDTPLGSEHRVKALAALDAEIKVENSEEPTWGTSLEGMKNAIVGEGAELHQTGLEIVEAGLSEYGHVTAPSKYDRNMQWIFILCLPFGVYYLFMYLKMSRRARLYLLTEEGTLTTPEGTWTSGEIEDIDMTRWIAKTGSARSTWTARVVLKDGDQVVLDDFIYRGMDKIIGSLAHKFYPEEWTSLARRVKTKKPVDQEESE